MMEEELIVKYIKRKNKIRKITTYKDNSELRRYHEAVVAFLRENTYDSIFAKAYVPKSSIYKNAEAHLYNDIFIKVDINNFFPSINLKMLEEQLYKEVNKTSEISHLECHEIVSKCSCGKRGLPLGLVSSPALANMFLKEFDGVLYGQIKKLDLKNPIYTRYADDLMISFRIDGDGECASTVSSILVMIEELLKKYKLKINKNKTQIINLNVSNHVRITGVSITKREDGKRHISVGRKTKNEIFWKAIEMFDSERIDFREVERLKGMLSFVLSIEKQGIENIYSSKMIGLLNDRGANNVKELLNLIEKR